MRNLKPILGVIGGSGVYEIDGLKNKQWKKVNSSFGEPSDELLFGELNGHQMVFLPRHGRGHVIPPSEEIIEQTLMLLSAQVYLKFYQ